MGFVIIIFPVFQLVSGSLIMKTILLDSSVSVNVLVVEHIVFADMLAYGYVRSVSRMFGRLEASRDVSDVSGLSLERS